MYSTTSCDKDLVQSYIDGNDWSLEILIRHHKERVYTYILLMVKDRELAEDLFQDTFFKVVQKLKSGKYNEEGKFIAWVLRIAHNLIIDFFRESKKIPCVEKSEEYDFFSTLNVFEDNVEDKIIREQTHSEVRRLIELLPREQKEIIMLRHFANMTFQDIADRTNININTALGRMRYALTNLRKLIEEKSISLTTWNIILLKNVYFFSWLFLIVHNN